MKSSFKNDNAKIKVYQDGSKSITFGNYRQLSEQTKSVMHSKNIDLKNVETLYWQGREHHIPYKQTYDINKADFTFKKTNQFNQDKYIKDSMKRSKTSLLDLARNNPWDWFITLTFDPEKVDRTDYKQLIMHIKYYLSKLKKRHPDLEYLFIAELHADGISWHFHGLIQSKTINKELTDSGQLDKGNIIYNLTKYDLGWSTATQIKSTQRVANYISKYVTKSMTEQIPKGCRRFINSTGLNKPQVKYELLNDIQMQEYREQASVIKQSEKMLKKIDIPTGEVIEYLNIYEYLTIDASPSLNTI